MRGPLVYCAEEVDNGPNLGAFILADTEINTCPMPDNLPPEAVALEASVSKYTANDEALYSTKPPSLCNAKLKLIPYYLWANRGINEMRTHFSV
jgi:DUF1680 family protein